jgi:TetR/AcrR family transcriptional regulator, transcriptional repressor for nem operon
MAPTRSQNETSTPARILDVAERLVQVRGFNGFSYADVLRRQRMCLCGMLAADYQTLPGPMREAILHFFDDNQAWLTSVLDQGRNDRTLAFDGTPDDAAQTILGGLEGAMLVARSYGDMARFQAAASQLLVSVTAARQAQ